MNNPVPNFENLLKEKLSPMKKELESLVNSIIGGQKIQRISPVVKWGQSMDNVLLEVKLAHRFDAPGCSTPKNHK